MTSFNPETLEIWRRAIRRVSFRGITIMAWHDHGYGNPDAVRLMLRGKVEDTYNPGRMIDVASFEVIPYAPRDEEDAIRHIQMLVRRWWLHEFDELFRVDGRIYDDPHVKEGV